MNQWHRPQPGLSRPVSELTRWLPPAMTVIAARLTGRALPSGDVSQFSPGRPAGRLAGRWAGTLGLPGHLPTLTRPNAQVSGGMYLRG